MLEILFLLLKRMCNKLNTYTLWNNFAFFYSLTKFIHCLYLQISDFLIFLPSTFQKRTYRRVPITKKLNHLGAFNSLLYPNIGT